VGRIIHVELTARDTARAAAFYAEAFGWRTESSPFADEYLVATTGTGEGIDGAIMARTDREQPTIAWLQVEDLDATVTSVRAAGGSVAGDVHEIPGQGRVVYVRDPEGTLVGLKGP
jgi:predicted enzyme related to lactoylglutathione lyase